MNKLPTWERSPQTVEDYRDLVARLGKRFTTNETLIGVERWIDWIEQLRIQPWAEVTARRYRASLLWFLESIDTFPISPYWIPLEHRDKIKSALRLPWAGESMTLPEKKKVPGKKMRSFGVSRWDKVRQRLSQADDWETVLWMEAVMRVGVRPIEWVRGVEWDGRRLTVLCAKGAFNAEGKRIRGLDTHRYLNLANWPDAERNLIAAWVGLRDTPEQRADLLKYMAHRLRWAWDQEFGSMRPRITLYTARHQFAANLRALGTAPVEIAAMMGHSSDQTQRTHYGRGASGKTGKGITPPEVSAGLVARVRETKVPAMQLPFRQSKKH